MPGLSRYAEHALLNAMVRNVPFTSPDPVYVALCTDDPGNDGSTANEVTGGGYGRQSASFATPDDGAVANDVEVAFPDVPAVTVTHFIVMDAETGGNPLMIGVLGTPRELQAGDTARFVEGSLVLELD